MHQTSPPLQPLQKDNNLSPRTKLASLVKGRWIGGKAQTVALLRFTCDMPTLFMLQTLLPPRRRDCLPLHRTSLSPRPLQKNDNPSPRTTFLPYERSVGFASLRNSGRSTSGIHARPLLKVRCCRPKKFGRLPEGLLLHQPSQNRTIPCFAPSHLPPLSKVRCCRPKKFGRLPEGLLFYRTLSVSQTPPLTITQ